MGVSFAVPAACFVGISAYGLAHSRKCFAAHGGAAVVAAVRAAPACGMAVTETQSLGLVPAGARSEERRRPTAEYHLTPPEIHGQLLFPGGFHDLEELALCIELGPVIRTTSNHRSSRMLPPARWCEG